jgi:hypothetical protein
MGTDRPDDAVASANFNWGYYPEDEDKLRAFAAQDPVVITRTATIEMGKMLAGFVRSSSPDPGSRP